MSKERARLDEMDECWTAIKEFALIAAGRCDT
jgi:hypothetical protein